MTAQAMSRTGQRRTGQAPPKRAVGPFAPVPAWDVRCRQAHAEGRAVIYHPPTATGRWTWGTVPAPPPGDDLPTWPAVSL